MITLALVAALADLRGADDASAPLLPIFNGTDLSGWKVPTPNPFWRVENGILVGEDDATLAGSALWTERAYRNFVFEAEIRWSGNISSGVMFRKPYLQMQLGTSPSLKRDMSGSFYVDPVGYPDATRAVDAQRYMRPGDWNTFRLMARDDSYTVWINGHRVLAYTDPRFAAPAPIGLLIHHSMRMRIEFRSIRAAELP
jgi:Domain of Unknown Function (DUF1080)